MDAPSTFQDQLLFHATGQVAGPGLAAADLATLRPALMAPYRDLDRLRHDYPLVLLDAHGPDGVAVPLSTVVSRLATELAPRGIDGERLRRLLLRVERALRTMVSRGAGGRLAELWNEAAAALDAGADDASVRLLAQAADSLRAHGELIACDERAPARLLAQAWRHAQRTRAGEFRRLTELLMRALSDILRAAWAHSQAGQQPQALRAAVGGAHAEQFDFEAMSRLVARRTPRDELPAARRQRIEWALATLAGQRLWPKPGAASELPAGFEFADCAAAAAAYRERLPALVGVVKAIAIAELEMNGHYVEAVHDPLFERFDADSLTAGDLALFPDYLVCIPPGRSDAPENAALLEMLSAGMPAKVLVQVSDLLEEASIGTGHFAFGVRSARLATTAMGLGGMFVLQAASSALPQIVRRIERGMACHGPALFALFAGSPEPAAGLPRYLTAAAAIESRAFPVFTYDAQAGEHWAARFSLAGNRDLEADWPTEPFEYADEALQRVTEPVQFTFADFAFTDRRHAKHFAVVPRERWHPGMLPVAEWLALDEAAAATRVPYLLAVDADDRLHRVLVDAKMMRATRACLRLWHRLQEHAGIHDSHAERLLAKGRARQQGAAAQAVAVAAAATATAATPEPTAAPTPAAAAGERPAAAGEPGAAAASAAPPPSDEAWIETLRCPSCNECQQINPRMFAYNENKQAYIKDITAGTYRDLVEAAESCQVAIIHPGKPRYPAEPGLAELIERARPFL
jgi:ferredoxin